MIDGLQLTIPGEELRRLLDQRIDHHRRCADRWEREYAPRRDERTEDEPLLPMHPYENEAERHEWRAAVLAFLRDHIEHDEVYRLSEADLHFSELLPEMPAWLEQDERDNGVFQLERIARSSETLKGEMHPDTARAGR